jgi:hypothetical protein
LVGPEAIILESSIEAQRPDTFSAILEAVDAAASIQRRYRQIIRAETDTSATFAM